ncbi:MAG: LysR substrate-binding domain-containing protein [Gammaproteobacteria bacterium]|jgi:LysR family hydrogen peroxide-inducible transcriptional activator|nr:LysR substrate-binding domain-containing protein [Gammaproteobacteria bacterium]MDH3759258.1 LysR substrate-binding domain-containing protein [Gammaproteobacteria bacterium]MDH3846510.1 LysR substrate-binding domain-containing protein [Gammaproteobacteria bacterium]MDH3863510.1 LysR substrate-binding domain-containing protein [Gammaproteobacteria bacterium]MDH4003517.1 LysR substrate-binding domain-containing protein [Gammaproteobacteria bacterium]
MKLPTVKQLRYFVALTETEHFGRAAEACFVSQSAFSNAIQELESLLEVQLVDRTNRSVTITAMGQQVATQARLCLRDVESLVEMARGQREPLTGELHLGVIPTIAPFLLPAALPKLRRNYPKLELYLHEDQSQRIYARLMDGELDLLLLALPYEMRGVDILPLFKDRFSLAYRHGTKRVDPDNYRFNRLDADSILLLEDGHCLRDHALAACKIRNTQKIRRIGASSVLTLVEMVDADLGITFLPELARDSLILKNTRVRMKPLEENSYRTIGLAWRKGTDREEEFRMLGEFLAEQHAS